MDLDQQIKTAIQQAIRECYTDVPLLTQLEEHGGWILKKGEEYKFFFLKNDNSGTVRAQMLFSANRNDVAKGPLKAIVKEGWSNYATFHTHPQFSVTPSSIDWNLLFQNSKYNFIYSPATNQLSCSMRCDDATTQPDEQSWSMYVWNVDGDVFDKATKITHVSDVLPDKLHDDEELAAT
jgi:proteasome lid subunit RPN8/RPN11